MRRKLRFNKDPAKLLNNNFIQVHIEVPMSIKIISSNFPAFSQWVSNCSSRHITYLRRNSNFCDYIHDKTFLTSIILELEYLITTLLITRTSILVWTKFNRGSSSRNLRITNWYLYFQKLKLSLSRARE